jgi:hypothetical protein
MQFYEKDLKETISVVSTQADWGVLTSPSFFMGYLKETFFLTLLGCFRAYTSFPIDLQKSSIDCP